VSLRDSLGLTKDFLHVLFLLGLLVMVVLGVFWFGASIWANVVENKVATGLPKMPAMAKAEYTVIAETTGDVLLTPRFDVEKSPNDSAKQLYALHGFYRVVSGKWRYVKDDFVMDEYYWGNITVEKRRE